MIFTLVEQIFYIVRLVVLVIVLNESFALKRKLGKRNVGKLDLVVFLELDFYRLFELVERNGSALSLIGRKHH